MITATDAAIRGTAALVAAFVVACVFGLVAPMLAHALVFASFEDAVRFFADGGVLAGEIAVVYIVALVTIAVAGALYARGRRVPPAVLEVAALAPFGWAVAGCVVRDRMRIGKLDANGYGRWSVYDFASNVASAEVVLDVAATMTAVAMLLVALAAIIRYASRRDGASVILVATVSSGVFAAAAIRAYGRHALFRDLERQHSDEHVFVHVPHGVVVMSVTRVVAIAIVVGVVVAGVVMARRFRALGGPRAFAVLVVAGLLLGVPFAIAARDDARFRISNPSALPDGVRAPASAFPWDAAPTGEPRVVVKRDGTRLLDMRDGKLSPVSDSDLDRDPLGVIADRDATFAMLARAIPNAPKTQRRLGFYVEPLERPEVSFAGALATFITETNTTAKIRIGGPLAYDVGNFVFITLDDPMLRIWHKSGPELHISSANDPVAIAARRAALASVDEINQATYLRVRDGDTLGNIWRIIEDLRAAAGSFLEVGLTTAPRPEPEPHVFTGSF